MTSAATFCSLLLLLHSIPLIGVNFIPAVNSQSQLSQLLAVTAVPLIGVNFISFVNSQSWPSQLCVQSYLLRVTASIDLKINHFNGHQKAASYYKWNSFTNIYIPHSRISLKQFHKQSCLFTEKSFPIFLPHMWSFCKLCSSLGGSAVSDLRKRYRCLKKGWFN